MRGPKEGHCVTVATHTCIPAPDRTSAKCSTPDLCTQLHKRKMSELNDEDLVDYEEVRKSPPSLKAATTRAANKKHAAAKQLCRRLSARRAAPF